MTAPLSSVVAEQEWSPVTGGNPLGIVHVLAPCEAGGLEQVVRTLARAQQGAGHTVRVIAVVAPSSEPHPFVATALAEGIVVDSLALPPRSYLRERAELSMMLRAIQPDVVHTHGYRPDVLDAGVARQLGIATVTTAHGMTGGGWKNRMYEGMQRRAWRRFDAVIAVSRPLGHLMRASGVPAQRVHLVRNAFDPARQPLARDAARRRLGIPAGAVHVGWIGRLSEEKGPDVFLDALARLPSTISASIIGGGAERESLMRQSTALGLTDRLVWHGLVSDAGNLLPAFDCVVMSSRTEGTPIVLLEAMHAGVPIVATAVGGIPDVVTHADALLVPVDQPAAIAGAISLTLDHPRAASHRAATARARLVRDHGVAPWVTRHDTIYRTILRSPAVI